MYKISIIPLLVELELAKSDGEALRLLAQGGVRINDKVIYDEETFVDELEGTLLHIGADRRIRFDALTSPNFCKIEVVEYNPAERKEILLTYIEKLMHDHKDVFDALANTKDEDVEKECRGKYAAKQRWRLRLPDSRREIE